MAGDRRGSLSRPRPSRRRARGEGCHRRAAKPPSSCRAATAVCRQPGRPMLPMLRLEQRLQQRYPDWFRGHRGRVAAPLLRGVARWSRFDAIDGFLDESGHLRGFEFVDAALRHLQLRYEADDGAARIPAKGRLLIVANHPSGALDALALLDLVGTVRRDVRIVANDVLSLVEPLSELLARKSVVWGKSGSVRVDLGGRRV